MKIVFNGYFYKNEKLKVTQAVKIFSENFKISRNFHFTVHSLNESESKKLNQKTFNICRNVIKKNAEIYDKDFVEELQYIVIHGLLHLIGYSHEKNDKLKTYESKLMKKIWNES